MIYKQTQNYTLYMGDVLETLKTLEDNSVDLIITSPPYNINLGNRKDTNIAHYDSYNDNMSWEDYVNWQVEVLNQCYRVLKDGGNLFYNHKDKFKEETYYNPIEILFKSKFNIKQNIIWDRGSSISYNAGMFGDVYENIYWCYKGKVSKKTSTNHNILGTVWRINKEANSEHPAPFPLELPLRVVASMQEDNQSLVVLDPFNGSATTGIASLLMGCSYIGIDISKNYLDLSINRLENLHLFTSRADKELSNHNVKRPYMKDEITYEDLWGI